MILNVRLPIARSVLAREWRRSVRPPPMRACKNNPRLLPALASLTGILPVLIGRSRTDPKPRPEFMAKPESDARRAAWGSNPPSRSNPGIDRPGQTNLDRRRRPCNFGRRCERQVGVELACSQLV